MKITDITIDPLVTGRALVRVHTDEGITGLAESRRSPLVFKAYLEDTIKPLLVGTDPRQIERHWETLSLGTTGPDTRATRLPSQIVGSIDIALWDILGKSTGLPVYMLMGGATRKKIQLYWSQGNGWKKQPEDMRQQVETGLKMGFSAFKVRMDWRDYRQDSDPRKDFAIFKYFILKALGFSDSQLRVVLVMRMRDRSPHAVLAVYLDENVYILDNATDRVLPDHAVTGYQPLFSFTAARGWVHLPS